MSDNENREPLIEPLPTLTEYINSVFPIIIVFALAVIALILMFSPQIFDYICGNSSVSENNNTIST
jgi:hypothetical protein